MGGLIVRRGIGSHPGFAAFVVALLLALVLLGLAARGEAQEVGGPLVGDEGGTRVAGELIVVYEERAPEEAELAVPRETGVRVEEELEQADVQVVEVPEAGEAVPEAAREENLEQAKSELEAEPAVASVDYNYVRSRSFAPSDPGFSDQYNLRQTGFPRAWNSERGLGALVAVVDSGIDSGHPDIQGKVAAQRDFFGDDRVAEDRDGHGTAVAGVAAAVTDNRRGVAGACPACRLLVAKDGNEFPVDSASIEGIYWATNQGADVINISSGSPETSAAYERAVNYARDRGALVVAAAGNESTSRPSYPAAYPSAVAVSATGRDGRFVGFSNRGAWVDLAAPGVGVYTTFPAGRYARVDGTSFSAPHVSALAGLLSAQGLTDDGVRYRMQRTATDLGRSGDDPYYGAGRIAAAAAVR